MEMEMEYNYLSDSAMMTKVKNLANIGQPNPTLNVIQIMDINNLIIRDNYVIYIKDFYTFEGIDEPGEKFFRGKFVRLENDVAVFNDIKVGTKRNGFPALAKAFHSDIDVMTNKFYTFKPNEMKISQELLNNGRCKLFTIDKTEIELPLPTPAPENIEPVITNIITKIEELKSKGEPHSSGVVYSPKPILYDLVYLKLLEKYGNKCSVVTVDDKLFDLSERIAFSGMELDEFLTGEIPEWQLNFLGETLKDCVDRDVNIIIIPVVLYLRKSSHANMLIYKPKQNVVERFEPDGIGDMADDFDRTLKLIFEKLLTPFLGPLTYRSANQVCPNSKGFQYLEASLSGFDTREGGGFCMMWSLFLAEMVLMNPDNTTKEIIDDVYAITKKDPLYLKQIIRGYVKDAEEVLDKLIKSVSDDTFSFIESENENERSIDVIKKHKDSLKNYIINVIINSKQPLIQPTPPEDSKIGIGGKRTRKYRNKKNKRTMRRERKNKRRKSLKKRY
jgi:hypothetical protein